MIWTHIIPLALLSGLSNINAENVFNVREYGAVGDGKTDDTSAFEAAIAASAKAGHGVVFIPRGGNHMIRPVNLTSNMEFYVQGGAKIMGMADVDAWPLIPFLPSYGQGRDGYPHAPRHTSLLHAEHLHNVTIRGDGNTSIIDGQGAYWWNRQKAGLEKHTRGHLIEFMYSSDIKMHNVAIKDSPFWSNHIYDCDGVHIHDVFVSAPIDVWGTDGWDPDSSRNVLIENSQYSGGDDCVAIKSGWDCFGVKYGKPSANITIRGLTCHGLDAGIALGSETSGGIENISVSNIHFTLANFAAHIKTSTNRGGYVKNVRFDQLVVGGNLQSGIKIDVSYDGPGGGNPSCPSEWKPPAPPLLEDFSFTNIDGMSANISENTFLLTGIREVPVKGLHLENVYFSNGEKKPNWLCSNVSGGVKSGTVKPWPPCSEIQVLPMVI